jgi:hypothetical protein
MLLMPEDLSESLLDFLAIADLEAWLAEHTQESLGLLLKARSLFEKERKSYFLPTFAELPVIAEA